MKVGQIAAVVLSVGLGTSATAGPFGIEVVGFDLAEYACTKRDGEFYNCTSIPKPHDAFETYSVRYHVDAGLCSIQAIGKDIRENGFGIGTRSKVDELYEQISQKYGKIEKKDFLFPTSIWNEPDEWLMGLAKDERAYAYLGDVVPPVEEIKEYVVLAAATSGDVGYVIVEFNTVNYEKCEEALTKDGASSF